jgi:hypothetical protein
MRARCTVCAHEAVLSVEADLLAGKSALATGRYYGLGRMSLKRHMLHRELRPDSAAVPNLETPIETFRAAFDLEPLNWQRDYLLEGRSAILLKGRQIGATQAVAALAIHTAMARPGNLVAIISPSLKQSSEVSTRARAGLWNLNVKLPQDNHSLLRLDNGSRIMSMPGSARSVRGFSADLLVLDEAAFLKEETFAAARALAATGGRLLVQSTPAGPVGPFFDLWEDLPSDWARYRIPATEVVAEGHIKAEWLAQEQRALGPDVYASEYLCEFGRGISRGLFTEAALADLIQPGEPYVWPKDRGAQS